MTNIPKIDRALGQKPGFGTKEGESRDISWDKYQEQTKLTGLLDRRGRGGRGSKKNERDGKDERSGGRKEAGKVKEEEKTGKSGRDGRSESE